MLGRRCGACRATRRTASPTRARSRRKPSTRCRPCRRSRSRSCRRGGSATPSSNRSRVAVRRNQDPRRAHRARDDARIRRDHVRAVDRRAPGARGHAHVRPAQPVPAVCGLHGRRGRLAERDVGRGAARGRRDGAARRARSRPSRRSRRRALPRRAAAAAAAAGSSSTRVRFRYPSRPETAALDDFTVDDRARRDGRVRRAVGCRQEHDVSAAAAVLRSGRGPRAHRRRRRRARAIRRTCAR